jgi:putative MATE family efflux protein
MDLGERFLPLCSPLCSQRDRSTTTRMPAIVHQQGTLRPLLKLVWPVLIEQVLIMLVGFSDTLLAGHYLGPDELAAMTVVSYAMWALTNLFAIVSIGALAMTARFVGAGDFPLANRVTNQSFVLGGILALAFTTVGLLGVRHFATILQLDGQPAALCTRYLQILLPMLPLMMLEQVGIGCLRGAGDMVTGLVSMTIVNVVNTSVSWALVCGAGPFPELGWDGLAIGTACGHALGGLIPFSVLLRGRVGLAVRRRYFWPPDPPLMGRILRIGLPGGIDVLSLVGLQLVYLAIINRLSTDEVAAHGVAIRIESLAYLPGYAFQVASATLVGQFLGAREPKRAGHSVLVAASVSLALLTGAGLLMFLEAGPLVGLFLSSGQSGVALIAPRLLQIVAVAMPFLALLQVLTGALRGAGDTAWPLAFTFIGFVGVRLPLAWLLVTHWQWGIDGAWYAMVVDVLLRTGMVGVRFLSGGWQRIEV